MTDKAGLRIRRFLLALAALSFVTTVGELLLVNHLEEPLQYVPWVICGLGFVAVVAALIRPNPATLWLVRGVMIMAALGGLMGVGVHLLGNIEFQQEIKPNASFDSYIWVALKGAAPLFAPGVLSFAALIALAATYQHPALKKTASEAEAKNEVLR